MEVVQAIRKLLFLEDCLIIPGLGGFISKYRPAVIDQATGTFFPPAKEIVFNSDMLQNDGTLVNFIAEKDRISIGDARQQVEQFVEDSRKKLEHKNPVYLDGIGHFRQDKGRRILFQADAGTNWYLESFGLATFHLREVAPEETSVRIEFPSAEIRRTHNTHNLRRIAIAMPLLIVFSLLPFNSRITGSLTSSPASMVPEPSLLRLNYPDAIQKDTARVIVFPICDSTKREDVRSEEVKRDVVKVDEARPAVGKFPVIAGCFKIRSNADRLHKQLIDKGYPAAIATSRNGLLFKVSVESFASRQEAINGLARLKRAEPGLELWVAL